MADGQLSHPTHPTRPQAKDDLLDQLRLIRSPRIGPVSFYRLVAQHGSASAALEALPKLAAAAGARSYQTASPASAEAELMAGQKAGARLVSRQEAAYPQALAVQNDAPPLLWLKGDGGLLQRPILAIVGARNASAIGLRMAQMLARDLGQRGYCILSGLARGIDAAAHKAALETGTIAVYAGGIDICYPEAHEALGARIGAQGLCLSEHPPRQIPQTHHFPQRNRLVAGLAQAVIVVEAAARSGSLITARLALDLGREVMAVPGHPFDARAWGANHLIREGAVLVRGAEDVIAALAQPPAPAPRPAEAPTLPPHAGDDAPMPARDLRRLGLLHQQILQRLCHAPVTQDQLIRDLGLPAENLSAALTKMELAGEVQRRSGGFVLPN